MIIFPLLQVFGMPQVVRKYIVTYELDMIDLQNMCFCCEPFHKTTTTQVAESVFRTTHESSVALRKRSFGQVGLTRGHAAFTRLVAQILWFVELDTSPQHYLSTYLARCGRGLHDRLLRYLCHQCHLEGTCCIRRGSDRTQPKKDKKAAFPMVHRLHPGWRMMEK